MLDKHLQSLIKSHVVGDMTTSSMPLWYGWNLKVWANITEWTDIIILILIYGQMNEWELQTYDKFIN